MQLYAGRLDGSSPLKKLQQGYSYTETEEGQALHSIAQVQPGMELVIHVTDGRVRARAEACEKLERNE
jgi:exodeoxyribonuclease VII large subunit